jgi:ABC-type dipeptide/oligopeptide/nickel transport system permease subunit
MATVRSEPLSVEVSPGGGRPLGWVGRVARLAATSPLGTAALLIVVVLAAVAICAPLIAPFDPLELHRADRLTGPSGTYWLGTDSFGRDQFSRLLYGTRVSLWVGIAPIAVSTMVGGMVGLISGYAGGRVDSVLQRLMDSLMAFPALLLMLVIVSLLGPSERNVILVLILVTIPTINRIARGSTIATAAMPFVESARSVGASNARIVLAHVLPNIIAPVLVVSASLVGMAILAEASLSFLGFGIPPPEPTWGNLLGGQNRDLFEVAPWLAIWPGVAITVTVLAFNILGDAARDLLDPRDLALRSTSGGGRS